MKSARTDMFGISTKRHPAGSRPAQFCKHESWTSPRTSIGGAMSNTVQDRPARHRPAEQHALNAVVERLSQQFPELSQEQIAGAVHGRYADYEHSRVRDFVPVLVERAARRELGTRPVPRHRA